MVRGMATVEALDSDELGRRLAAACRNGHGQDAVHLIQSGASPNVILGLRCQVPPGGESRKHICGYAFVATS